MATGYFLSQTDRDALARLLKTPDDVGNDDTGTPANNKTIFIKPKQGTSITPMTYVPAGEFPAAWVPGKGVCEVWELRPDYTDDTKSVFEPQIINPDGNVIREVTVYNTSFYEVFYTQFSRARKSRRGVWYVEDTQPYNWLARVRTGGIPARGGAACELVGLTTSGSLVNLVDESSAPILRKSNIR